MYEREKRLASAAGCYVVYQPDCSDVWRPATADEPDAEVDVNSGVRIAGAIASGMAESDAIELARTNHQYRVRKVLRITTEHGSLHIMGGHKRWSGPIVAGQPRSA